MFSESDVFGCNFHFSQTIWRRIQFLRAVSCYKKNTEFKKTMIRCIILCFYPHEEVFLEFKIITVQEFAEKEAVILNDFFAYFEKYYIGKYENDNFYEPHYLINF